MTPEGKVKEAVVRILIRHNVYYFFPFSAGFGRAGIPDIIACCGGRMMAIECKAPGKKPTALQDREMQRIRDAGGWADWVDDTRLAPLEVMVSLIKAGAIGVDCLSITS